MKLFVEFGGGLEALNEEKQKRIELELTGKEKIICSDLIAYIANTVIVGKQRDLFVVGGERGKLKIGRNECLFNILVICKGKMRN